MRCCLTKHLSTLTPLKVARAGKERTGVRDGIVVTMSVLTISSRLSSITGIDLLLYSVSPKNDMSSDEAMLTFFFFFLLQTDFFVPLIKR